MSDPQELEVLRSALEICHDWIGDNEWRRENTDSNARRMEDAEETVERLRAMIAGH